MDHYVAYYIDVAHAAMGILLARRWVRPAAETGLPRYAWFKRYPLLAPLRRDAEFQVFLTGLKKSFEAAQLRYAHGGR